MNKYLRIFIELSAVIPAVLFIPMAIYGIVIPLDHVSNIWNDPLIEILELFFYMFLGIAALAGGIGLLWGFLQKVRNKTIKQFILFRTFLLLGILAAIIMLMVGIFFIFEGGIAALLLITPIYVGISFIKYFNLAYNNQFNSDSGADAPPPVN